MDSVFKLLTPGDIPAISPYFAFSETRTCDNSVGAMLMWRDYFRIRYAVICGSLVFALNAFGDECFQLPLGADKKSVADALGELLKENGSITLCSVSEDDLTMLESNYRCEYVKEDGWSDYLYNAEDLAFFKGRKYNGQRNHLNAFRRNFSDYGLIGIDSAVLRDIKEFLDGFSSEIHKDSELFGEELAKTYEIIGDYGSYPFRGLALYAEGRIVGFTMGEIVGDTLLVHIEKADRNVNGAYQMLMSGFAGSCLPDISFVNREEDVGDEGLRKSKLSYHPCRIIDKYTVTIKNYER